MHKEKIFNRIWKAAGIFLIMLAIAGCKGNEPAPAAEPAADRSHTTQNGNSYRTTVGIVRQNIAKTQSLGLARAVERHSHCPHPSSTGQITARSAGQSSDRRKR